MNIESVGTFLMQLNGLELIGIGVVYLLLSGIGKTLYNRYKKKENPHIGCKYYPDFKLQIKLSVDKAIRIFNIKEYRTIKEQMSKVDKALSDTIDVLMTNFMDIIKIKYDAKEISAINYNIEDESVIDRDINYYDKILFKVSDQMKNVIRNRIIENHILDKTDNEFRLYSEHANRNLVTTYSALLDREYNSSHFLIGRPELKQYNLDKLSDNIMPILNEMWNDIRNIAIRADAKTKEITNE